MAETVGESRNAPERPIFNFKTMHETGVLWLINRVVFHPRGFALALEYNDGENEPRGWSIQGDGSETWRFEGFDEDKPFAAVEALLAQARQFGKAPHLDPVGVETGGPT